MSRPRIVVTRLMSRRTPAARVLGAFAAKPGCKVADSDRLAATADKGDRSCPGCWPACASVAATRMPGIRCGVCRGRPTAEAGHPDRGWQWALIVASVALKIKKPAMTSTRPDTVHCRHGLLSSRPWLFTPSDSAAGRRPWQAIAAAISLQPSRCRADRAHSHGSLTCGSGRYLSAARQVLQWAGLPVRCCARNRTFKRRMGAALKTTTRQR